MDREIVGEPDAELFKSDPWVYITSLINFQVSAQDR